MPVYPGTFIVSPELYVPGTLTNGRSQSFAETIMYTGIRYEYGLKNAERLNDQKQAY
jgi:hypothetical protein